MNHKTIAATALLLLVPPAGAQLDDQTFAVVNGKQISNDLVGFIAGDQPLAPEQLNQLARRLLANIAVAQEAEKLGLDQKAEISYELDLNRTQILARSYIEAFLGKNPITDQQIEERYAQFATEAAELFEYRARHILVQEEDKARELLAEIGENVDKFAELASAHSIDKGSAVNGGLLEWSVAETYVPEFARSLQSLSPGEFTSAPVQTQFGWHLIHLDERRKVQVPALDDEQRQRVTEALRAERIQSEFDRILGQSELQLHPDITL